MAGRKIRMVNVTSGNLLILDELLLAITCHIFYVVRILGLKGSVCGGRQPSKSDCWILESIVRPGMRP